MKKFFKIFGIILLILFVGFIVYIFISVPTLNKETERTIQEVIDSELPELIIGDTGHIVNRNTRIWYESVMPQDSLKGSILMFMGISNDALGWPQSFLEKLTADAYQVIRFDYRGTGLSDWCKDKEAQNYSLKEIAEDAKIILDTLDIKQAHLLGVSMGGMIAQEFAINYPERVHSLISIMSSGNIIDDELESISMKVVFEFIKLNIRYGLFPSEKNSIKLHVSSRFILQGNADYDHNIKETAEQVLFNLRNRRGFNPKVSKQHNQAVLNSGSRYDALKKLHIPVLIIHGKDDPFIPIEHSYKLSEMIPKADTLWVENMGHDIPECHYNLICNKIYGIIDAK